MPSWGDRRRETSSRAPQSRRRPPAVSLGRALATCLACCALLAPRLSPADDSTDPNAIKADMVCNIAKFVQWPDAVMSQNNGRLVVAVLGEDDLGATLASVLSSRFVNGKPIWVRFARRIEDVRGCQIVYIAGPELHRAAALQDSLRGAPVLTIANEAGFASRNGIANFSGTPPNLKVEICRMRAEQSGLRISSRLLALARVVEPAN